MLAAALTPAARAQATAAPGQSAPSQAAPGPATPAAAAPPPAATAPAATGDATGEAAGAREKALLERIRQLKAPRWRAFGACRYDWSTWRLAEGAVRTTAFECGPPAPAGAATGPAPGAAPGTVSGSVAVHCDTLKLTRRVGDAAWEPWRLPYSRSESTTQGGEDEMLASLCANVTTPATPAAAPAAPPAAAKPAAKPATPKPSTAKPASSKPSGSKPATP